jgi:hypothetical protein
MINHKSKRKLISLSLSEKRNYSQNIKAENVLETCFDEQRDQKLAQLFQTVFLLPYCSTIKTIPKTRRKAIQANKRGNGGAAFD